MQLRIAFGGGYFGRKAYQPLHGSKFLDNMCADVIMFDWLVAYAKP
jgi:hypothetical protein